jgi:hypothetical protein
MTLATNPNSIDWMIDVGVPGTEIMWLKSMIGSPKLNHPVAARRVKNIQQLAYAGLLATSTVSPMITLH